MIITNTTGEEQMKYQILRITDIDIEPSFTLPPIIEYEEMPLVSLELAVKPLLSILPSIEYYTKVVKQRCKNPPANGLTIDESAAIMLYSMGWQPEEKCLFVALNTVLRSKYRERLKPWSLYLKLFLTALSRLPSLQQNIYRGIKWDLNINYRTDQSIVWWGFSSCTNIMNILQSESFSDTDEVRTLLNIKCQSGKDISKHCYFSSEDEIILLPGTQFKFRNYIYQGNPFRVIELEEISTSDDDLQKMSDIKVDDLELKSTAVQYNQIDTIKKSEINIPRNTKWIQNGVTVAGGNGLGQGLNQLFIPSSFYMDNDNQIFYIADCHNGRIIEWKFGATSGEVVAGGDEEGKTTYQLDCPSDVIIDKEGKHLIICDTTNRRIVRWPRKNGTYGEIIFSDFFCNKLAMDNNGDFYISDCWKNEVRRWTINNPVGIYVAGKGGGGKDLDQLNSPSGVFVDADHAVYISDTDNHRVMKWVEGGTEGIIVAGGHEKGDTLEQLAGPRRLLVDTYGDIYVADCENNRIVCWCKGATEGKVIVGGNGEGDKENQLNHPRDFSFDREGNLYVLDSGNHRIQKFDIDRS